MTQHSLSFPTVVLATTPRPELSLPDADTCWQAVQRRDRAHNGRFWFSVKTTGVYCLPSCAARPPLRGNVAFHASPEAAEAAGFRPCKRCKPRDWRADLGLSKPVARACELFDAETADSPPSLAAVARRVGLSSGALSKRFLAELGVNPRDWLIARKRQRFRRALRDGSSVAEAIYGAGYGSPSRVYESSDRALGMTPATYAKGGAGAHIDYTTVQSDYGRVLVAATEKGIAAVFLGDDDRALEKDLKQDFPAAEIERNDEGLGARVKAVLSRLYGRKPSALDAPDVPLDIVGTAFQWKVWKALTEIPPGETRTYGEIAVRIGAPKSARAVGRACATNQAAVVIPCHRAVGASGALTGYRWGVARKERLLAEERRRSSR
ncbi:MAG: bifunctional DNA-binding transcriptional regulator/O6-methylguanine-DNA methyltransferase Ada [Reyranella sp.]|jgi:AraC family transcriptional regulator of adaptative response/methylated-DNA-[protein]-cysteine methyltransferase|uniref:bifunctional DNA-binding transcriptional regulator/O6-methylguanine-DNA methyltransferase Ada n=1 Tax=Reyranella sp. TaxID=1929291 RepID=UPI0025E5BE3B|nr:bifunctional DNA-binding transcriptional regulator/O6-methylguanine-DNA methyltransferase Ada [Reyranella sp.]MBR2815055.1 bifunctional DNA-binding transcriptional regulator/O6-methylguanine-DNA methyltransferase Ada [Reyranella sp.]